MVQPATEIVTTLGDGSSPFLIAATKLSAMVRAAFGVRLPFRLLGDHLPTARSTVRFGIPHRLEAAGMSANTRNETPSFNPKAKNPGTPVS